jgi:hypothetical protein
VEASLRGRIAHEQVLAGRPCLGFRRSGRLRPPKSYFFFVDLVVDVNVDFDGDGDLNVAARTVTFRRSDSEHLGQHRDDTLQQMDAPCVTRIADELAQAQHIERRCAFHSFTARDFVASGAVRL